MALGAETKDLYTPTIGIECHVQLKTKTKLFSAVGNDARDAAPNSLISHIDVGMPGALPVLNKRALELAARAAFALNTQPQKFSKFDRKHYFYPDLPKGYQISQYENPIIIGGFVEIKQDGQTKRINITRAHLEEDAGKNTHPDAADYSLVDLNRAGTPLLEIVSEPEIHSAAEAKAYARELYLLMKYADVSEVDLYHGNMRFDVNISVSKEAGKLGKRAEVKNLNSFRSVEAAVNYEIERQINLQENHEQVVQETRGWDEAKQQTTSQRGKEEAHDYRYMPEPDVPPINLEDSFINDVKLSLPEPPRSIREKLSAVGIDINAIEDILDSDNVYDKLSAAMSAGASNDTVRRIAFDSLEKPETLKVKVTDHIKIADSVLANKLSSTAGSNILSRLAEDPGQDPEKLISENAQVSDEGAIDAIVAEVLAENQKAAEDVKNGEAKAIGFLVGQVMAKSKGQANPQITLQIIKKQLGL